MRDGENILNFQPIYDKNVKNKHKNYEKVTISLE